MYYNWSGGSFILFLFYIYDLYYIYTYIYIYFFFFFFFVAIKVPAPCTYAHKLSNLVGDKWGESSNFEVH